MLGRSNLSTQRHRVTEKSFMSGENGSVFQRHHCLVAAAESGDMLEAAVGLFQQHDWAIAEDGMTVFRHVPDAALARMR